MSKFKTKIQNLNFGDVTPEVWARTIISIIVAINQVLAVFGKEQIPITDSQVYQIVSIIATLITWAYGFWKNESYTKPYQESDAIAKAKESNDADALSIAIQTALGELEYEPKPEQNTTDHHATGGIG